MLSSRLDADASRIYRRLYHLFMARHTADGAKDDLGAKQLWQAVREKYSGFKELLLAYKEMFELKFAPPPDSGASRY